MRRMKDRQKTPLWQEFLSLLSSDRQSVFGFADNLAVISVTKRKNGGRPYTQQQKEQQYLSF